MIFSKTLITALLAAANIAAAVPIADASSALEARNVAEAEKHGLEPEAANRRGGQVYSSNFTSTSTSL